MLTIGDTIKTVEPDGLEITVTINEIHVDPYRGSVLLCVTHSAKPNEQTPINLSTLQRWYKEAKWVVVKAESVS